MARALGRPEQRCQARRHTGRHEHLPHLPPTRLGREPREPGRELAVALPDHLRVVGGEETAEVAVQTFDAPKLAVERHGQRGLAVAHAVRFQLDQRLAQPSDSVAAAESTIAAAVPSVSCTCAIIE